jgi:hypothetical protein
MRLVQTVHVVQAASLWKLSAVLHNLNRLAAQGFKGVLNSIFV